MSRYPAKVKITCLHCKHDTFVPPHIARLGRKFCSTQCAREYKLNNKQIDSSKRLQVPCTQCGTEVVKLKCQASGKHVFCSQVCKNLYRSKKVEIVCPICETPFMGSPGTENRKGSQYCSRECFYKAETGTMLDRVCPQCSKEFQITATTARWGKGIYCSVECQHEAKRIDSAENEYKT
jgi:endogenous inhibitor of DNA gyrase (YacG/DUF329 family)